MFGLISTIGFAVWLFAPTVGAFTTVGLAIEPWVWIFVGLLLGRATGLRLRHHDGLFSSGRLSGDMER